MPELIDLRRRIKSVRNTQQITQAMKTVATAKFKKAQRKVLEGRPYWHNSPEFLARVTSAAAQIRHPLLERRDEKRIRMLIVTSDKGLAGAFNANLLERAHEFLREKSEHCEIRLTLLGKKAVLYFKRLEYKVDHSIVDRVQNLTEEEIRELAQEIMREYALNRADAVYVAYNEFKSILAPRVTVFKLLPLEPPEDDRSKPVSPDWEPEAANLIRTLLPGYIEDQVLHCVWESIAAEHAARMMAMDNATKNADELIDNLTLVLNKIRQASITKELLEIMSAVEALSINR
jgi:F-type H+-transporting ATPase subunit gamma